MDEEYGVSPEETSWREYPDGDVPIEEFTLDEMAEDEVPEDLYSQGGEDRDEREELPPPSPELYSEGYEDPVEWEEDEEEKPRRRPNLLSKKGKLRRPCWAETDVFEYNKENLRHPSRRKEWEFYQLSNSRYVFQVTYGHAAYAGLAGVTLVDSEGKRETIPCDGLFIAIGLIPENEAFRGVAELDAGGYFVSSEACGTRTPGIFAAGDCRSKSVRQLTTAAADGAAAALAACRYIDSL